MFGSRNPRPTPPRQPPSQQQPGPYSRVPQDGPDRYGASQRRPVAGYDGAQQEKHEYSRGQGGQTWQLQPTKSPGQQFIYGNLVAVSPFDFPPNRGGSSESYIIINDLYVVTARQLDGFPQGQISLSDFQRSWASISLQDTVYVKQYDPFQEGGHRYLGSLDAEVSFAGKKETEAPLDQDELQQMFTKNYENQVLAPGQRILMDYKSIPMLFVIKAIQLVDLSMDKASAGAEPSMSDPRNRGILTRQSQMSFFKDAKSRVNLKASKRRPAANAIFTPDFKFEDMGIGGLDKEFSAIFRRAFASRIFPPGLIESMGIQHVKGILLFGPPGTGKTLIARRIGKMLNAREPKVINGPEVLNKYVGQSEENIRKLFADAEKEYKEKGDESGLHIIIFDVSGVSLLQVVSEDDSAALLVRALCKNEQVSNPTGPPSARQAVPNEGIPRCRRGRGRMKLTVQSLRLSMIRLRTMSGGPKVLLYNMTWFMFWGTHSAKNATSSGIWPVDASFQVTTYFEVYLKKFADSGILQELDAVCKQRGSGAGGGTGVGDSVVNQLLSKLDGVDQLNNILLIGMTNRMDMIDDALLRPGRLEVHMEISLPDEYGRVQILKIHTSKMRESGNLDPDVSIEELAHLTKNFSGAEISGLVRSATSFALNRHVKVGTMAGVSDDVDKMTVNRDDFEHAFDDVKPSFGVSEDEMQRCLRGGIIHFSEAIDGILNEAKLIVKQVQEPDSTPLFSTILYGPPGSGKTALAAQIALASEYPLIKMCSPDNMIGMTESMKIEHMRRIFDDAYKSPLSVVVIDNIERIIEWVPVGPRFSNPVLQAMMVLLKKEPPRGRRLLVLATTGERSVLQQLDVFTSFDSDIAVPNVKDFLELSCIMKQSGAFSNPDRAIQELREMTQSESVGVGIKKVLLGIETAKQDRDREGRFAQTIARAKAQMGFS